MTVSSHPRHPQPCSDMARSLSIFVNQEGVSGDRSSRQIIKHIEASGAARSLVTTFRQS